MKDTILRVLEEKGILSKEDINAIYADTSSKKTWALNIVHKMHHSYMGTTYVGEKFTMTEADEVYMKYKGRLNEWVCPCHVYVALNAQYHDYCPIFKRWDLSNIEHKIIESAMDFWFFDEDYEGCKVEKYFSH